MLSELTDRVAIIAGRQFLQNTHVATGFVIAVDTFLNCADRTVAHEELDNAVCMAAGITCIAAVDRGGIAAIGQNIAFLIV